MRRTGVAGILLQKTLRSGLTRFANVSLCRIGEAIGLIFARARREAAKILLHKYREVDFPRLSELFESRDPATDAASPGFLIQRLEMLGVNPAGNDVLYQEFKYDGNFHHWTELFDFTSDSVCWRTGLSRDAEQRKNTKLPAKVVSSLFNSVQ